jgi:hypothetical protein
MARPRRQPDEPVTDDEMAERMAALEEALRPFAAHGVRLRRGDRMGAARKLVYDQGESVLLLGDFDRARLLIFGGN